MNPLAALAITLPRRGSRQLLASLHGQLRAAILDGRLRPGVRLPSTRHLAQAYGLSRTTVVAAYDLLLSEGYVAARRGSGTVVAGSLPRAPARPGPPAPGARLRLSPTWRDACPEPPASGAADLPHCFRVGVPDVGLFPFEVWQRLGGRILRGWRAAPPREPDPQGLAALREAIAKHVSYTRAVACGPQDIVVTSGAQQAFDLLARVLTTPGRTIVALEDPGYPPLRRAFQLHGARIAAVAVDAEGIRVDAIPPRAAVVCVTPSHQFPLGTVLSAGRRTALLESCQRRGAVVIEDDYDGEFRYADRPLDALQTLDRSQSVFYVGTFSKSLMPDLRLGYVVALPWALPSLVAAKRFADGPGATLVQATAAALIDEGHLARHLRKMQRVYAERRTVLLAGIAALLDESLQVLPGVAGLHVALRLGRRYKEQEILAAAGRLGVELGVLAPYYLGRPAMQGLVMGYGAIGRAHIAEGLLRLRRVLRRR